MWSCSPILGGARATARWLARPVDDAALAEIVGCEFNGHSITLQYADVVLAHLPRDMRGDDVSILQFDAKSGVGQGLGYQAFHLDRFFFRHASTVERC